MANRIEPQLIPDLFEALQAERLVTLATVDNETKGPALHALSWIWASDEETIRFAAESRSRIVENIKENPVCAINLIANESTYAIHGKCQVLEEKIPDVPFKGAVIEMKITEIRDIMFYGSKITGEPKYEKTYDLGAAEKLDSQIMNALKRA
ncbi:hypothetical protein JOC78_000186 [Bacillus ectoiniformans]|uniref:pyridoxamine 5'-phosphate oxidase family protein n=1 Tax=Bacillus ectoiniformans TaxID=1494429 RepID=UPI001958815F|nr:pyridoxamine 5'-phosphate oxidase family protein [Bacillus ectoiniformans]MBM7647265.1 hypothetical protein [Bacillus ectoiniformans]